MRVYGSLAITMSLLSELRQMAPGLLRIRVRSSRLPPDSKVAWPGRLDGVYVPATPMGVWVWSSAARRLLRPWEVPGRRL
jgi:hypothetical protein